MHINLTAGQEYNLSEENTDLSGMFAGLGWDVNRDEGDDRVFDLDASAFLLSSDGKVLSSTDFIYYNNLKHPSGAVTHTGDNRTGEGEGDDEAILFDFSKMPDYVERVVITASIYEAADRDQTFGQIKNAYIRIYDEELGELFRYDLGETFSDETAVVFGEIVREDGQWKFHAIGEGYKGGILTMSLKYGVFKKR